MDDHFIDKLSLQEKNVLKELLEPGSVLSFNEKAMVQIFSPSRGLIFIDLGDSLPTSLEKKGLICLKQNDAWEVKDYQLSEEGREIAQSLVSKV